jgi:hypothetical protein
MTEMLNIDLFWLCCCSQLYIAEEEEEVNQYYGRPINGYQSPMSNTPMSGNTPMSMSASTRWGGTEEAVII